MSQATPRAARPVAPPQQADLAKAEQVYARLARENPDNVEAWYQLGLIGIRQRRHETAIDYLEKAAALAPGEEVFHHYLGICCQAVGQLEQAATHFAEFIRKRPESAEAHNSLNDRA